MPDFCSLVSFSSLPSTFSVSHYPRLLAPESSRRSTVEVSSRDIWHGLDYGYGMVMAWSRLWL